MVSVFPCHLEIKHKRRRTGALSLKNKPEQTYSYCVFWSGLKGTYGPRNFDWIARNGRLSAESRGKPNVINADFYHKGDFCLIGLSNLEFHWLIHWNLVNSFESREDDCQLCHKSAVGFPLSSFLFVMRSWRGLSVNSWFCEYFGYYLFYMEESFSTERKSWGMIDKGKKPGK